MPQSPAQIPPLNETPTQQSAKPLSAPQGRLAPVDRFQRRHAVLAVPIATFKKFGDDNASTHAVALAFWAFFSLFPLLLVFVTILGYVLAGNPTELASVRNSVLGQFPVIGDSISHEGLQGSASALIIGVALTLWSGLSVTNAGQNTMNMIWGIPKHKRAGYLMSRLRGLVLLSTLGTLFVLAALASGLVTGGLGGPLLAIAGCLFSLVTNFFLFMVSFQILCTRRLPWRSLIPGSIVAAFLWEVLQVAGGAYIEHIKHSDSAYGTFALVLGILTWLHLGSQMTVLCGELNTVVAGRLWPRALTGEGQPGDEPAPGGGDGSGAGGSASAASVQVPARG